MWWLSKGAQVKAERAFYLALYSAEALSQLGRHVPQAKKVMYTDIDSALA
jgi:hypothetical protein